MHPWTMQRLAEERRHQLLCAAAQSRAAHESRCAGSGSSKGTNHRATRFLGELLIKTGWRLVGPEAPASGIRPRLAFRGSASAIVDPC